jgi:hypothetical protein
LVGAMKPCKVRCSPIFTMVQPAIVPDLHGGRKS